MTRTPDPPYPASVSVRLETLKKRRDFLAAAASGRKWVAPGFILQILPRPKDAAPSQPPAPPRCGFTASGKVGNAVIRNRCKRRLRDLARRVLLPQVRAGYDFVLIARPSTVTTDFTRLATDLDRALTVMKLRR